MVYIHTIAVTGYAYCLDFGSGVHMGSGTLGRMVLLLNTLDFCQVFKKSYWIFPTHFCNIYLDIYLAIVFKLVIDNCRPRKI